MMISIKSIELYYININIIILINDGYVLDISD